MEKELKIFANQTLLPMRRSKYRSELASFRSYDTKARELLAHMEVLSRMERPGRLNEENRRRLQEDGADIRDRRQLVQYTELDVITNYHVEQLLLLRKELLEDLSER